MEHDPVLLSNTAEWLRLAQEDLDTAELSLNARPPLLRSVLFQCQQYAEKAFKALLTWHDRPFRKTHSLEEIGAACANIDPALITLIDRVTPLAKYAVRFRYPGAPYEVTLDEAQQAFRSARDTLQLISSRLPPELLKSH